MTETERKALALVNEVSDGFHDVASIYDIHTAKALRSALCRAIEQHEAFRQEVSEAVEDYCGYVPPGSPSHPITRFIIAKPDPLVEALWEAFPISFAEVPMCPGDPDKFRAALAARGLKIVEDKS